MLTNPWERLSAKEVGSPPGVRIQYDDNYQADIHLSQFLESPGSCRKKKLDESMIRHKAMSRSFRVNSGNWQTEMHIDRNDASFDDAKNQYFTADQSPTLLPRRSKFRRHLDSQIKGRSNKQTYLKAASTQGSAQNPSQVYELESPVSRCCPKGYGTGECKSSPGISPCRNIFNSHKQSFSGVRRVESPRALPKQLHLFTKFSRTNEDLVRNLSVSNGRDNPPRGYNHSFPQTFIYNVNANGRTT